MSPLASLIRATRFSRCWLGGRSPVRLDTLEIDRGDRRVRLLRAAPSPGAHRRPAWIVLHGITRPGLGHPMLQRYARAVAASGATVWIPEVPEWVDLHLAPDRTTPTVLATLDAIADDPATDATRVGLMGFSFGAPQSLVTASDPRVHGRISTVAGFGGYGELEGTVRFQLTGEFEYEGRVDRMRPDPYGRWIYVSNYLTRVQGHEDAGDVAEALHRLACAAGELQVPSWDPVHDPRKRAERRTIAPERRELFDFFAPPTDVADPTSSSEAGWWIPKLAEAGRVAEPLVDPVPHIGDLPPSVHLMHGREDILIPFTQTLALARALGPRPGLHVSISGLYAHSASSSRSITALARTRESARFAITVGRMLGSL